MNNLAETLREQGDIDSARKIHEQVLEIRRRILGDEHPHTLTTRAKLALTLRVQGDLPNARKIQETVLEIRRKKLGDEHPYTIKIMDDLAETLRAQDDLAGARKIQEKLLEIRSRLLGDEHPDTSLSAWNLHLTLLVLCDSSEDILKKYLLWLLDRDPASLEVNQQKIREIIMNQHALMLCAQGDLVGARQIQEKVLEITRRTLGDEHPNTITKMKDLAAILRAQGDFAGARKIQEKLLEIRCSLLGEEHPDTSMSACDLVVTLFDMGDAAGADDIMKKHLVCLVNRDPASLEVNQRKIREMMFRVIGGKDQPEQAGRSSSKGIVLKKKDMK
jgi:tetratricopeptide (TPR) repeat protein